MKSIKTPNYTWLYFKNPKKDDLAAIQKTFDLHPAILGEFNLPIYRPRIVSYKNYTFMVFHFPIFNPNTRFSEVGELDILINKKYLVTSLNKDQPPLTHYFEHLRKKQGTLDNVMPKNTYSLLIKILDELLNSCFPMLDHISCNLDKIEDQIFKGREKKMVKEISIVKRDMLRFRRIIKPQRSTLKSLALKKIFQENLGYKSQINNLIENNIRVWNVLENHKDAINSLEATNDSLFSYKLNETMKVLTVFSVIFLPATLTAGIFGMNINLPVGNFWIILSVIIVLMLLTLVIIKSRRWI